MNTWFHHVMLKDQLYSHSLQTAHLEIERNTQFLFFVYFKKLSKMTKSIKGSLNSSFIKFDYMKLDQKEDLLSFVFRWVLDHFRKFDPTEGLTHLPLLHVCNWIGVTGREMPSRSDRVGFHITHFEMETLATQGCCCYTNILNVWCGC